MSTHLKVAAVALAISMTASARERSGRHLVRHLTPEESSTGLRVLEAFVSTIVAAGTRSKHDCRIASVAGRSKLPTSLNALAVPGALALQYPRVVLHCDENPSGYGYPSVALQIASAEQNRTDLRPPRDGGTGPGVRRWTSASGAACLYLETPAEDGGSVRSAVRIDVYSGEGSGILEAIDEAELVRLLSGVTVLSPARRPEVLTVVADGGGQLETERQVVGVVLTEVAGEAAKVIVRKQPARKSVTLDAQGQAAMAVVAPDLDSELFPSFVRQQAVGPLPSLPASATAAEDAEIERAFKKDWPGFHRRFPGADGVVSLSPIAFSADATQAILTVELQRGPLDGIGALYVLQRQPSGVWRIVYESILWLS